MVALGMVLLVLAVLAALGVVLFNGQPSDAEVFGVALDGVSVGALFLGGLITGVVGALGLFLVLGGAARSRSKSVATRRRVRSARTEAETLAEENARLRGELDHRTYPGDESATSAPTVATSDATRGPGARHD